MIYCLSISFFVYISLLFHNMYFLYLFYIYLLICQIYLSNLHIHTIILLFKFVTFKKFPRKEKCKNHWDSKAPQENILISKLVLIYKFCSVDQYFVNYIHNIFIWGYPCVELEVFFKINCFFPLQWLYCN